MRNSKNYQVGLEIGNVIFFTPGSGYPDCFGIVRGYHAAQHHSQQALYIVDTFSGYDNNAHKGNLFYREELTTEKNSMVCRIPPADMFTVWEDNHGKFFYTVFDSKDVTVSEEKFETFEQAEEAAAGFVAALCHYDMLDNM